ncbi:MAG: ribonuclease HI [Anaerolineae bacterium]|nr:MAG: ribonuclease HI [Anaerolineae bacterium]
MSELPHVVIYTDGACRGNPGPGGWAALLRYGAHEKAISGGERETTNNRMELTAAIEAFRALKRPCRVDFYTDSEYLKRGITEWLPRWKRNGWKTTAKKPVKNQELWRALDEALQPHQVVWHWVRGHAGQAENERVDRLARRAIPKGG